MEERTAEKLLAVNRRFYTEFGAAFAATRRRIQPGVGKVLGSIPRETASDWLDLGCGSAVLAQIWAGQGRTGSYTGMDFSGPLLQEAISGTAGLSSKDLEISFIPGDLMDPDWPLPLAGKLFDGICAFASLHHIPVRENHRRIFTQVRQLLRPAGRFIFSVWQFQNSPKLMQRVQPWSLVDIDQADPESGDTLLDWRYALAENAGKTGLRYVHLFSESELASLAEECGFDITDRFRSDGAEGNLALYMELKKRQKESL